MTERCSLWSALSAAACCFYRGSFMQVQVSRAGSEDGESGGWPGAPRLGAPGGGGGGVEGGFMGMALTLRPLAGDLRG